MRRKTVVGDNAVPDDGSRQRVVYPACLALSHSAVGHAHGAAASDADQFPITGKTVARIVESTIPRNAMIKRAGATVDSDVKPVASGWTARTAVAIRVAANGVVLQAREVYR